MASLFNTKISNTYVGLIKTLDNAVIDATLRQLSDGSGNGTGLSINNAGDFKATGTIEWGSLKDTGENITITKFVDEADGIANNDNDTTIPTSAAIVDYVAARITLEDLDFSGDSGTGSVDLDSQVFAITGTANQIETTASGQGLSFAFPSAGVILPNGSTATTQSAGDNSTKVATTAYVETAVDTVDTLAEILAIGNTTGATKISVDNTSSGIDLIDDAKIRLGTSNDLQIYHDATNSYIDNQTNDLYIRSTGDDIHIQSQDDVFIMPNNGEAGAKIYGGGAVELYFNNNKKIETTSDGATVTGGLTATGSSVFTSASFSDNVTIADTKYAIWGDGSDFKIHHNTSDSYLQNYTGGLYIQNNSDDKDIIFQSDDGVGGVTTYFYVDGSGTRTIFEQLTRHDDNVNANFGSDSDLRIYHDSSNSYIEQSTGATGDLIIQQKVDDKDIIFKSDDGSGGTTEYFRIDGGLEQNVVSKNMKFDDNVQAVFGAGIDLRIYHDTSANNIINENGALKIEQKADDGQIIFYNDDGSGGVTQYLNIHGTEEQVQFLKDSEHQDNVKAKFGTHGDLEIFHDASNSYIDEVGTGDLYIQADSQIRLGSITGTEKYARFYKDGKVELFYDNAVHLETTATGVTITGALTTTGNISSGGHVYVTDTNKFIAGSGEDLQIYHDGTDSYIDNSTGDLWIRSTGDDLVLQGADDVDIKVQGGEMAAKFGGNGGVDLYHNDIAKFSTTSTGISVTGKAEVSTELVVGSGEYVSWGTSGSAAIEGSTVSNRLRFYTDSTLALTLDSSQDASFGNSVTIAGDLTVNGTTTTVNTDHFNVEDPLISMAKDNAANTVDIGFYGRYNDGSNRYLGLFSDASDDNRFKLFKGTTTEPTTTVDTGATGYEYANILLASLESRGNIKITNASSPHLEITDSTNTCTFKAYAQDSNAHIGTMTNHSFVIDTNGTAAMTLDTSQNAEFAGDVTLSTASTPQLRVTDTTNTVISKIMSDDTTGYVGTHSDHNFSILRNNSVEATFTSNGLGIGTTGGTAKLEVSGGSLASGTVTNLGISTALTTGRTRAYDSGTLGSISTRGDSTALELVAGSSAGYFTGIGLTSRGATAASGTLIGYTYGAERFRVDAGGDFGINVTNPVHKLHVGGDAKISNAGNGNAPILHVIDTADTEVAWFEGNRTSDTGAYIAIQHLPATAAETNRSGIKFQAKDDGDNTTTYAQITQYISDNTDTTEDGDLAFSTVVNGSLTENMRISGGNVGIGVTPQQLLHLKSDNPKVYLEDGNAATDEKVYSIYPAGSQYVLQTLADDYGAGQQVYVVDRTGTTVDEQNFYINNTVALTLGSSQLATFTGDVTVSKSGARLKLIDGSDQLNIGQWDGSNHRIEGDANRPVAIQSYEGNINLGISGGNTMSVHSGDVTFEKDIIIHNTTNAPYIDFVESGATTDSKARITMDQVDTDNASLIFSTEGGGTLTERMKIASNGAVTFTSGTAIGVTFKTTDASYGAMNVYKDSTGTTRGAVGYNSNSFYVGGEASTNTIIQAGGQTGLFIDKDSPNNIGIGTTSPDFALDIEADDTGVQLQMGRTNTNVGSTWMGSDSNGFHIGVGAYGTGNSVSDVNGIAIDTDGIFKVNPDNQSTGGIVNAYRAAVSVSTSATVVGRATDYGGLAMVWVNSSGNIAHDLVSYSYSQVDVLASQNISGSPVARTYSASSGGGLKVAMASGTYDVYVSDITVT